MKVRIRRRLWVALMVDRKTGASIPRWTCKTLREAKRTALRFNREASDWGYWACVVPFRYDELTFIKRRARKRAKKQQRDFLRYQETVQ